LRQNTPLDKLARSDKIYSVNNDALPVPGDRVQRRMKLPYPHPPFILYPYFAFRQVFFPYSRNMVRGGDYYVYCGFCAQDISLRLSAVSSMGRISDIRYRN